MPLHRRHTISSGASPKKKKTSSAPRVPFLPASDHKLTQLFEDLVWQVEQGVHRIEFLERELRLERAPRVTWGCGHVLHLLCCSAQGCLSVRLRSISRRLVRPTLEPSS